MVAVRERREPLDVDAENLGEHLGFRVAAPGVVGRDVLHRAVTLAQLDAGERTRPDGTGRRCVAVATQCRDEGVGPRGGIVARLGEAGEAQPDELALISPWVDITNTNPDIADYVDADPLMVPEPLADIGRSWAGDTPLTDWHLSPIYGDLSGLKKVTTFVGTREIFLPDNALFHAKLLEAGVDSTLHVGENLNHVYPMFPTPEGRRARRDLVRLVTGELA